MENYVYQKIEKESNERKAAFTKDLEQLAKELNFTGSENGDPDWVIQSRLDIEILKKKYEAAQPHDKRDIAREIKLIQQKIRHHKFKLQSDKKWIEKKLSVKF